MDTEIAQEILLHQKWMSFIQDIELSLRENDADQLRRDVAALKAYAEKMKEARRMVRASVAA